MRRVLIGTPAHDGRVDVWCASGMFEVVRAAAGRGIDVRVIFMSYDSLVQRARNDLVKMAIEQGFDDLVFIDSDQDFAPKWFFELLEYDVDVVGAPVRKKTDEEETYNVKATNPSISPLNGLVEVEAVGCGMLRISSKALKKLWHNAPEYKEDKRVSRMVFGIAIVDGMLVSEDNMMCRKWRELGGKVWVAPHMDLGHIGPKKWVGDFRKTLSRIMKQVHV